MSFCSKSNRVEGFSLIEVMVATAIVTAVFVAMFSVFAHNLQLEIYNRNKITASYLVQEGLEIVKQKRDTNWFSGASWDAGIPAGTILFLQAASATDSTKGWTLAAGSGTTDVRRKIYLCNGRYIQANSASICADSGFQRTISITKNAAPPYMAVTVTVKYNNGTRAMKATSYLYGEWGA